ncbi:UDP-glucoronosyl and UDP-glucosyl transferase, partial [Aphelenchoides avenae]
MDAMNNAWGGMSNGAPPIALLMTLLDTLREACDHHLSDNATMEMLKAEKFDLAIGEVAMDSCFLGIVRRIGVQKHISVATTGLTPGMSSLGVPALPSLEPFLPEMMPNMTYLERFMNYLAVTAVDFFLGDLMLKAPEKVMRKHLGDETFDVKEEIARSSYFFVNTDEHISFPKITSHKLVYAGGIGMPKGAPLDQKFEEIMESSKEGVVLVSFGTMAKSSLMPNATKQAFLDAFAQFPNITFLWKYETPEDGIADAHPNVVLVKWQPQISLL